MTSCACGFHRYAFDPWNSGRFELGVFLVRGQDRFAFHVLLDDLELVHEEQGLGAFLRQRVEALLEDGDLFGIGRREVVLLRRVLREIEQLDARR